MAKKYCSKCKEERPETDTKCTSCNGPLSSPQFVDPRKKAREHRRGVRSLVGGTTELITNSDKSHKDLLDKGHYYAKDPFIIIEVWEKEDKIQIRDNAEGFFSATTASEGIEKFQSYGAKKESHTDASRNLFGAGLSDTIWQDSKNREGRITWQTPGGNICSFTFKHDVETEQDLFTPDNSPADEIKKQVENHGTCITFFWKRPRIKIPPPDEFKKKLETWYELKNILDPKRKRKVKVSIVYHDKGGKPHHYENLKHSYYRFEKKDLIPDLKDIDVNFEAGKSFKIIRANLKVVQDGYTLNNTGDREEKNGGLYIEDENENIFALTLFGNEHKHYSKRVLGTVLLNTDFKKIVRHEMDANKEYPLKDDRTGFDFGHKLSRKLKKAILPWLEKGLNKLKNEGGKSETNDMGEANKAIDKLIKAITDEDLSGPGFEIPDDLDVAIQFELGSYEVSTQVNRSIRVFIDTKEIGVGETIQLSLEKNALTIGGRGVAASDFQLDNDSFKVPDPESGKDISAYMIEVSCASDGATDKLTAEWNTERATTELVCKAKNPPPKLSGELLFWPQNMNNRKVRTIKEDTMGMVTLYAESAIIDKIDTVDFVLKTDEELEEEVSDTIVLGGDYDITSDKREMSFKAERKDFQQDINGYHSLSLEFTPKKKGISSTLTATATTNSGCVTPLHQISQVPADCFKSSDNSYRQVRIKIGKPTGSFRGWRADHIDPQQAYIYDEEGNEVIFNLNFPLNKSYLGDSPETAKARAEDDRAVRTHIANGILETVVEKFLIDAYAKGKKKFGENITDEEGNVEFPPAIREFLLVKHRDFVKNNSNAIHQLFVKDFDFEPRTKHTWNMELGSPENAAEVILRESAPVPKIFNNLSDPAWQGVVGTLTTYSVSIAGVEFTLGVWKDTEKPRYYIKMHNSIEPLKNNESEEALYKLRDVDQVYEAVMKNSEKYWQGSAVFTRCIIGAGIDANNSITKDDLPKIPDPPNIGESITEHTNWVNSETDEPYIRYDERKNVIDCTDGDPSRDKLVCVVENGNTVIMAANFVRTVILPMVQNTLDLSKKK